MTHIASLLVLLLLSIASYSNTMHVPFQFDDEDHITANPLVHEPYKLLLPSKTSEEAPTLDIRSQMRTRVLAYLSFAINHRLSGPETTAYHIVNLCIHLINALMVYLLALWLIRGTHEDESAAAHWIALSSAALFALHPVQTQAVTYISQRFASMCAMFYICSVALYVRHRQTGRLGWLAASIVSAVAAMHTKEIAFTLPFAICLVEFLFPSGSPKQRLLRLIPYMALLPVIPAYMLLQGGGLDAATSTPASIPRWTYLITSIRVLTTYIRMLALPYGQNIDHDYALSRSLLEPDVLLSLLILGLMLAMALMLYRRASASVDRQALSPRLNLLAAFGVLWFFLSISIENSIIPLDEVIYEHRMYLPSAGIFMAFSAAVAQHFIYYKALGHGSAYKAAGILAAVLLIALSLATYARNEAWRDPLALWSDALEKSPRKARPMLNLGAIMNERGDTSEALRLISEAVRLDPGNWRAHQTLGSVLMKAGRLEDALAEFEAAAVLGGSSWELYNNMGIVQARLGMEREALMSLQRAVWLAPMMPGPAYNLGRLYLQTGERIKGVQHIKQAMRLDETAAMPHYTMGLIYLSDGDVDAAVASLEEALRRDPAHIQSHRLLAELYERKGLSDKAALHKRAAQ